MDYTTIRPYLGLKYNDLLQLFSKSVNDLVTLKCLEIELSHRGKNPKIPVFREILSARIKVMSELDPEAFIWPRTEIYLGNNVNNLSEFKIQEGFLSYINYKVGKKGLTKGSRRRILDNIVFSYVIKTKSTDPFMIEYVHEWGLPNTGKRLKKLAYTIAGLCRLEKRRKSDYSIAIKDREDDLKYLYYNYYKGTKYQISNCDFDWPRT